jgi:coiled-coil and C2 domain-containing protein 2A
VLLAELYAPIPENTKGLDAPTKRVQFSSDRSIRGAEFDVAVKAVALTNGEERAANGGAGGFKAPPVINGLLQYTSGWGALPGHTAVVPPVAQAQEAMQNVAKMRPRGEAAFRALEEALAVAENAPLDPNDPRNEGLLSLKKTAALKKKLEADGGVFRLWSNDPSDGDLHPTGQVQEPSKRFALLRLRTKEAAGYKSITVPLRDEDVPEALGKKLAAGNTPLRVDALTAHISEFRQNEHARRLQKLRAEQIVQQRKQHASIGLVDVVDENPLPEVEESYLSIFFKSLFAPARPLRPARQTKAKAVTVYDPKECEVTVTVRRAWGLPSRDTEGRSRSREPSDASTLRPFVQVVFQNATIETSVASGPSPAWNEELKFPFVPFRNDFSPESLRQNTDKIYINVFDEVVVDVLNDPRQRATTEHNRLDKQFLGTIAVPFSTLLSNPQLDGTYRVKVPAVMLGYTAAYMPELVVDKEADEANDSNAGFRSYLSVFITIDPPLQVLRRDIPIRESTEDPMVLMYNERWQAECQKFYPNRDYNAITLDINSRAVFIPKYIIPQTIPQLKSVANSSQMKQLARFVSMIPNTPDAASFVGNCDLWTTSDQFFNMLSGDEEEHAILLCNYFLSMSGSDAVDAFVLLGTAVPEGPTAYVLTRAKRAADRDTGGLLGGLRALLNGEEDPTLQFWNAVTGECYSGRDSFSPLKRIDVMFNGENVWGNIQLTANPTNMTFDLTNGAAWRPFFTKKRPANGVGGDTTAFAGASVQSPVLVYTDASEHQANKVQMNINKALKQEIRLLRERNGHTTRFNGMVSDELKKKVLIDFEEAQLDPEKGKRCQTVLAEISKQQGLSGFPINFAYVNMEDAVEQVTSVYHYVADIPGQGLQFGLGVHVAPYPNDVYSVWVYLVTISSLD